MTKNKIVFDAEEANEFAGLVRFARGFITLPPDGSVTPEMVEDVRQILEDFAKILEGKSTKRRPTKRQSMN